MEWDDSFNNESEPEKSDNFPVFNNTVDKDTAPCLEVATGVDQETAHLPVIAFGLDLCFHTFNKMYIYDILMLQKKCDIPEIHWYNDHPIYKVDVLGIVVRKDENSKCFMYAIDDGTGVITCCCWKHHFNQQISSESDSHLYNDLPKELHQKAMHILNLQQKQIEGYSLGDRVHVRGKLKYFRDQLEVVASYHKKIDDPNIEVMRMVELPKLYTNVYDFPPKLPRKVMEELFKKKKSEDDFTDCKGKSVIELQKCLSVHITANEPDEIAEENLLKMDCILQILSEVGPANHLSVMHEALGVLEENGIIYRKSKTGVFEVIKSGCDLEGMIKDILQRDCAKEKFQNNGCHYLHIVDVLRKTSQYKDIKAPPVLTCLSNLEMQSDVIRTTFSHYFICNI